MSPLSLHIIGSTLTFSGCCNRRLPYNSHVQLFIVTSTTIYTQNKAQTICNWFLNSFFFKIPALRNQKHILWCHTVQNGTDLRRSPLEVRESFEKNTKGFSFNVQPSKLGGTSFIGIQTYQFNLNAPSILKVVVSWRKEDSWKIFSEQYFSSESKIGRHWKQ